MQTASSASGLASHTHVHADMSHSAARHACRACSSCKMEVAHVQLPRCALRSAQRLAAQPALATPPLALGAFRGHVLPVDIEQSDVVAQVAAEDLVLRLGFVFPAQHNPRWTQSLQADHSARLHMTPEHRRPPADEKACAFLDGLSWASMAPLQRAADAGTVSTESDASGCWAAAGHSSIANASARRTELPHKWAAL